MGALPKNLALNQELVDKGLVEVQTVHQVDDGGVITLHALREWLRNAVH
jgi:hypothetical protein